MTWEQSDLLLTKAKGFKDEREVGIKYSMNEPDWKFLSFRTTPWGITPYIKLTSAPKDYDPEEAFAGSGTDYARQAEKLPIQQVRIGPTPNRKTAKKTLQQPLERNGYAHVKVTTSKIPFR